jgi:spore coat polysaccharide biosynthesis protein SpsF (cytidylyltransferase family)
MREMDKFKKSFLYCGKDLSKFRFTVDNKVDYFVVKKLVKMLPVDFVMQDLIDVAEKNPKLMQLNAGTVRDEKYWRQRNEANKIK